MTRALFWSSLVALVSSSFAVEFDAPTHTETAIPNETGVSPKPTEATTLNHREFKRQAGYLSSLENPVLGYCGFFGTHGSYGYGSK
jgi:hypothetical protein